MSGYNGQESYLKSRFVERLYWKLIRLKQSKNQNRAKVVLSH